MSPTSARTKSTFIVTPCQLSEDLRSAAAVEPSASLDAHRALLFQRRELVVPAEPEDERQRPRGGDLRRSEVALQHEQTHGADLDGLRREHRLATPDRDLDAALAARRPGD